MHLLERTVGVGDVGAVGVDEACEGAGERRKTADLVQNRSGVDRQDRVADPSQPLVHGSAEVDHLPLVFGHFHAAAVPGDSRDHDLTRPRVPHEGEQTEVGLGFEQISRDDSDAFADALAPKPLPALEVEDADAVEPAERNEVREHLARQGRAVRWRCRRCGLPRRAEEARDRRDASDVRRVLAGFLEAPPDLGGFDPMAALDARQAFPLGLLLRLIEAVQPLRDLEGDEPNEENRQSEVTRGLQVEVVTFRHPRAGYGRREGL
jgi:hypothetical protein